MAAIVAKEHLVDVGVHLTERGRTMISWQRRAGLILINEEIGRFMITNGRKRNTVKVVACGQAVVYKSAIKYLRVMIETLRSASVCKLAKMQEDVRSTA